MTEFLAASFLLLMTPGPTNTLLAACGARNGFAKSAILPLAEAAGYAIAISAFVAFSKFFGWTGIIETTIKLLAALWLAYSAVRLWHCDLSLADSASGQCFRRVFLTTLVNPKALIVATVLLPSGTLSDTVANILAFALLSTSTGLAWVGFGQAMPAGVRNHAYKIAAVILTTFSAAVAYSTLGY